MDARSTPNKRVLMIAYAFPPLAGSGVHRTVKFAKYLPQNGWRPIILTGDGADGGYGYAAERDESLLDQFAPEGVVYRAGVLDPLRPARRLWASRASSEETAAAGPAPRNTVPKRALRAARQLWQTWVYIPDDRVGWLLPALSQARRITREHQIDVIYSTSDPFTDHLLGYLLSRLITKPWVADFRDPWTLGPDYQFRDSLRGRVDSRLERLFARKAARAIVVCEGMKRQMVESYNVPAENVVVITNGFDEDDFRQAVVQQTRRFTIAYVGRFAEGNHASPAFLKALRELLNENPDMDMRVLMVGYFGRENEEVVRSLDLGNTVERLGHVPHSLAIRHMLGADVLLLTLTSDDESDPRPTGKIFEYLGARRPILGLVPPNGYAARIIRETQSGITVGPTDVAGIKKAIAQLYDRYRVGTLACGGNADIGRYTRAHLTARLAQLFDDTVRTHRP